ncbi:MAG: helix-turn-helix domain-containing protein [Aestuariibacter sp.]
MHIDSLYFLMFILSSGLMLAQVFVRKKTAVHLTFAVFCGSLAMVAAQYLGKGQLGSLSYFVALGTCATCNVFWLVSRALFRGPGGVTMMHISVSVALGLLMMSTHGLTWLQEFSVIDSVIHDKVQLAVHRVIVLTSSTLLMLSVWEGCRKLSGAQGAQLVQRILFLASFLGAVISCKVISPLVSLPGQTDYHQWFVVISAIQIMVVTQLLIYWRQNDVKITLHKNQITDISERNATHSNEVQLSTAEEESVARNINAFLVEQRGYLQPNIKMSDLARTLNTPEYKIRSVMRHQMHCKNFNEYLNKLRIQHALQLLNNSECQHWPVLVVGLESGFGSVGPFTRAFKIETGMTPGQYRQQVSKEDLAATACH